MRSHFSVKKGSNLRFFSALKSIDFRLTGPRELIGFIPPIAKEQKVADSDSASPKSFQGLIIPHYPSCYPRGRTENNAATFLTSGSRCLDFFFQVVPDTSSDRVIELLSAAWEDDSLLALKLVFQLRGVRGTGKSNKQHFYDCALWLFQNHPATLTANVRIVPEAGYYKDLLELLRRIVEGPEETEKRMKEKKEHRARKAAGKGRNFRREFRSSARYRWKAARESDDYSDPDPEDELAVTAYMIRNADMNRRMLARNSQAQKRYFSTKGSAKEEGTLKPREERVAEALERDKAEKQAASVLRKNERLLLASRVVERHSSDVAFAGVYNAVAEVFAEALAEDLEALSKDGNRATFSLAAKWCPSLDSSYDRQTLLCEAIASKMFPKSTMISGDDEGFKDHHHYVFSARDKLRKDVLVPLRIALELPEVYMSAQRWNSIPYRRVASVAMKTYKELFIKHDEERFRQFLDDVEQGKTKIAAGALLPHEIVQEAIVNEGDSSRVAELQWTSMVEEMKRKGSLASSVSVCDVSGSMDGTPMEVCIALGMLTAELSEEPWNGKVITFSQNPQFHTIAGTTLKEKYEFTARMEWGMNTDLQKVFDRILELAVESKVPAERMLKRIFVFSDMEFDEARVKNFVNVDDDDDDEDEAEYAGRQKGMWETDYELIRKKYRKAGYEEVPQIVFWNLRDSLSTPVQQQQDGVALVSGFSKNLLKMFLDKGGEINPTMVMIQAVTGDYFEDLVVVD